MTRIFLIRHGEPTAPWHAADDPGLSALGAAQAEAAAAELARHAPGRIISSPLRRCRETAVPFATASGFAPLIEPRVAEVPSPPLADRQGWLRATFPGAVEGGAARGWDACGETILRWRRDIVAALCGLEDHTAVFTHFIAINAAVSAALGRDEAIVCRPAHASITELVCADGTLKLVSMGAQVDGRTIA
ncbi:MAG TPA: histidine phosphatase family protein [Caulobacterales bacterium]|nr:histidine phosphatase family protein [Caulobacterales bacterium]